MITWNQPAQISRPKTYMTYKKTDVMFILGLENCAGWFYVVIFLQLELTFATDSELKQNKYNININN